MTHEFRRTGELKEIASYPEWLQRVVAETRRDKMRVVEHELFALMRDAKLPLAAGDYAYAEQVNRALTDAVRRAAAATGTTYVDVWGLSKGHDICSDDPWVNGAQDLKNKAPRYHPFLAEHEAVAKLVASMVQK